MRTYSPKHWCARLPAADAARFLVVLECARQNDWRRITRTIDGRLALRFADDPDARLTFGRPAQDISTALRTLNRQLSQEFFSRFQNDRSFCHCVLREVTQALLEGDVELAKALMRRMIDATVGFAVLGELMETHPKSVNRMVSPTGNPSARHLTAILAQLTRIHRVRLTVT